MNICLLTYRGNPFCGGQGVYIARLAEELIRQGHQVHCISGPPYPAPVKGMVLHRVPGLGQSGWPEQLSPELALGPSFSPLHLYERAGAERGIFSEIAAFSFRSFFLASRLMRRHRFDVFHDNQTLGWGTWLLKSLGRPVLTTIHHPLTVDRQRGFEAPTSLGRRWGSTLFFPVWMQTLVARRMERMVTVSMASRGQIARDFGVNPARIDVVPNGVDLERFRPMPQQEKIPGRMLFVGNVSDANKGFRFLLEAMARMKRQDTHLAVVNAGPALPDWVVGESARLGVAGRIHGEHQVPEDELARHYNQAEVMVSPSLFEGFGFPAAEAMACGLPVVAANGGGLVEVVGEEGLRVPIRSPQALADALDRLFNSPTLRENLGRSARAAAEQRFRWDHAAQKLAGIYQEMIHAHG
ncbi:MAG: glycosyltransferase family 4 protein [Deltaproteobacteria bacterium]|nr:glycosyltransferase family 4 protein [Deltaproteobacteria bacterium]